MLLGGGGDDEGDQCSADQTLAIETHQKKAVDAGAPRRTRRHVWTSLSGSNHILVYNRLD